MEEVAKRGVAARASRACPKTSQRVFKTAHEIPFEWHVRHQARLPEAHRQRGVQDHQPAQRRRRDDDVARPTSWPGSWAASASPCSATAARASRSSTSAPRRDAPTARRGRGGPAAGGRQAAPAQPHGPRRTGWRRRSAPPSSPSTSTADGEPFEVFVQVGKAGSDTMAVAEALGRLISLALRLPSPLSPQRRLEEVISQLSRSAAASPPASAPPRCSRCPTRSRASWPSTSARRRSRSRGRRRRRRRSSSAGDLCQECGQATFVYEEGCKKCYCRAASTSAEPRSLSDRARPSRPWSGPGRAAAAGGSRLRRA